METNLMASMVTLMYGLGVDGSKYHCGINLDGSLAILLDRLS
jgi:hypothetical protein